MYLCQYFSDVLPLMYVFPYYYSALMALHTVLHVDTVLVAVALMIMTSLGPSPGLGHHNHGEAAGVLNLGCGWLDRKTPLMAFGAHRAWVFLAEGDQGRWWR